jgi:hypothetical protein
LGGEKASTCDYPLIRVKVKCKNTTMANLKVDKSKFDDLLGKLIKAKPLPEKKVKAAKKRSPRPIIGKSNH